MSTETLHRCDVCHEPVRGVRSYEVRMVLVIFEGEGVKEEHAVYLDVCSEGCLHSGLSALHRKALQADPCVPTSSQPS